VSKITLTVNGRQIEVDLENELEIANVSVDQSKVAAKMAFWGELWASAEAERLQVDTFYRNWRAKQGEIALNAEPKMAEWKVKQRIESSDRFLKVKETLASAIYNATMTKSVFESFRIKANALQSKGAMLRAELEATGMTTKATTVKHSARKDAKETERQQRTDAMRDANRKKKQKVKA